MYVCNKRNFLLGLFIYTLKIKFAVGKVNKPKGFFKYHLFRSSRSRSKISWHLLGIVTPCRPSFGKSAWSKWLSINSRWMNFRKFINSCCYVEFSKLKNKHNKWWGLNAYFLIPSVVIGGCTRGSSNPGLELSLQSWVDDDYDNNLVENHQCWCLT